MKRSFILIKLAQSLTMVLISGSFVLQKTIKKLGKSHAQNNTTFNCLKFLGRFQNFLLNNLITIVSQIMDPDLKTRFWQQYWITLPGIGVYSFDSFR